MVLPKRSRPQGLAAAHLLGRRESTDRNVIPIRISKRELGLSVRIYVWFLFKLSDERARPLKRQVEIIDPEKQQETVAGCLVIRAHQREMLVGAPLMEAEQYSSI